MYQNVPVLYHGLRINFVPKATQNTKNAPVASLQLAHFQLLASF